MTNTVEVIKLREYDLMEDIGNEQDLLESFVSDFYDEAYICDYIAEMADSYTPIYYNDIWEHAQNIKEYANMAISEGLVDIGNCTLDSIMQCGYYWYYDQLMHENLNTLIFNIVADSVNELLTVYNEQNININELEDAIDTALQDIDNNSRFWELEEVVKDIGQMIKNDEFNL